VIDVPEKVEVVGCTSTGGSFGMIGVILALLMARRRKV